jgi:hypothetical protein
LEIPLKKLAAVLFFGVVVAAAFGGRASTVPLLGPNNCTPDQIQKCLNDLVIGPANVSIASSLPVPPLVYANNFKGADPSIQINNCLAALGGAAGTCDASSIMGKYDGTITGQPALTQTIVLASRQTLILGDVNMTSTATPAISYSSWSVLKGIATISRIHTSTVGMASTTPAVQAKWVLVQDVAFQLIGNSAIGINFVNTSFSNINRVLVYTDTGTLSTGSVGIVLDGNVTLCTCFVQILNPTILNQGVGIKYLAAGNSNTVAGGEFSGNAIGMQFATGSDANRVWGTDFESQSVDDIQFDAGTTGNVITAPRFEETNAGTGITKMVLNNANTFNNTVTDAYDSNGNGVSSFIDNTGTLIYRRGALSGLSKPVYQTIAQTLAMTCAAASIGNTAYVKDTVGSAAVTFHLAVAGAGVTTVDSPAYCDGTSWRFY